MFGNKPFATVPFASVGRAITSPIVTGVVGTGQVGDVVASSTIIFGSGVQATGYVGTPLIWGLINDSQTVTWTRIPT
jgi:hypothetical protein